MRIYSFSALLGLWMLSCSSTDPASSTYLQISGIYPHLTAYNQPEDSIGKHRHRECGIGAVVPWADHLWYLTYPPHMRTGSNDKLYMVDETLKLTIRKESIGGTHANRMIHRESQQLFMGPYAIDMERNVRGIDVQQLEGRMTATMRHLTDPENKLYFYDMEGKLYEVDVNDLSVKELYQKPVPGWHGKGGYTGQGRVVIANNGEHPGHNVGYEKLLVGGQAKSWDEAGVLAEWDGENWAIVERKQFTDVTGPGGIYGNASEEDPIWSMGWDKRSVILKLLEGGEWHSYRLPKGSHTFDPRHGWFTEWPRIREIGKEEMLMVMHGTMFSFPRTFSTANTLGISPIATHLRYIPDFCEWNGQLVLASDDASTLQNPIVGQPQSNLWFGSREELNTFGPKSGWGGVWMKDTLVAGQPSDPFLLQGYEQRILHIQHQSRKSVLFEIEVDQMGTGNWEKVEEILVATNGYGYKVIPKDWDASWIRLIPQSACIASAYFHFLSPRNQALEEETILQGLANVGEKMLGAIIRPAGHNRSLQMLIPGENEEYWEVSLSQDSITLVFTQPEEDRAEEVKEVAKVDQQVYSVDDASVIVENYDGTRYRLPMGSPQYENLWSEGAPRALREVQSERYLANISGMFYEVPRAEGASNHIPDFQKIKPISRHDRAIADYCSWRGLLVLAGIGPEAKADGQVFRDRSGVGLWFGMVDDLWKFDKPTGVGGPWKETDITAGESSDPYLMTGFDKKRLEFSHNSSETLTLKMEVAINHQEWVVFDTVEVPGHNIKAFGYDFPEGFQAHWIRLTVDKACTATATFFYE